MLDDLLDITWLAFVGLLLALAVLLFLLLVYRTRWGHQDPASRGPAQTGRALARSGSMLALTIGMIVIFAVSAALGWWYAVGELP
jgi:hypothetical protein